MADMVRAAVQTGPRQIELREFVRPQTGPDDGLLRVEANGICRSDWHAWTGDWTWMGLAAQPGAILGHEFCGVVALARRGCSAMFASRSGS